MVDEMTQIITEMKSLGDDVVRCPAGKLTKDIVDRFQPLLSRLRKFIPGLEAPFNQREALDYLDTAQLYFVNEDFRNTLSQCFYGLSAAPHHPEFMYLAAASCRAMGQTALALLLYNHVVWINPAYPMAGRKAQELIAKQEKK